MPLSSSGPVWLSVVMPTYNGADYLGAALGSVAGEGVEVLVVDDGSTDESVSIARSFEPRLRMRVFERGRGGNWVAGVNFGLREASGEFASILHQDDLWLPGRADAIRQSLDTDPSLDLVTHDSRFIDSRGRDVGAWTCPLSPGRVAPETFVRNMLVQNNLSIAAPTFRRSCVLESGSLREALWYTADWELWLRLGSTCGSFHIPKALAAFRLHSESQTVARPTRAGEMREQMFEVAAKYLPGARLSGRAEGQLRRVAEYSVLVNSALAGRIRGTRLPLWDLALGMVRLGPVGLGIYLQDSRLPARIRSRIRAR